MQQRGSTATMDNDDGDPSTTPPSRGRLNSKLVRSHAMREETSPPRAPSPCLLQSPFIHLTPSQECPVSPNPVVVLSPSRTTPTAGNSPQCVSPTSTLVATPNSRCSPLCDGDGESSEKKSSQGRKKYCDCQHDEEEDDAKERNFNNNVTNVNNNVVSNQNTLSVVNKAPSRGRLRQQSSSQGSFEGSVSNSPCLSKDGASELYTDTTGVDLEMFIPETLNRNAKDRALMLRIEQELVNLAKDRCKTHYKFPPMSSYQRMLVHRCAAYFGMDHNIEPSGKCVVVNKTKNTRIPDVEFKLHIKEDIIFAEEPRRSILKRDSNSMEEYCFKSLDRGFNMDNRRSKSFEEREEEYERARRRIFNRGMQEASSEDFVWCEIPWSSTESDYSSKFRLQPPDFQGRHFKRLIKVHSEDTGETMRPCVAKSYSFGGYGGGVSVLTRGDSVMSTHSAGPRLLTKQDSGASSVSWRLSPSSSGYKSQSQMSESVTPSPTSTPHPGTESRQDSGCVEGEGENQIVWAVTDIHNVPKGSIIINPQTGKPLKNEDGSVYHYDPANPPSYICQSPSRRPLTPPKYPKERPESPKKIRPSRSSPTSKTTVATSPSLPFTPPLPTTVASSKSYPCFPMVSDCENVPPQQHFPFSSSFPPADANIPVYQQPYIVYTAPYDVSIQPYDNRIDQPTVQEIPGAYYVADNTGIPPAQYQQQPQPPASYWNQQAVFYQTNPQTTNATPPQRYSVPIQAQGQTAFGYQQNYISQPTGPCQNGEVIAMYPGQTVQMVYPNPSAIYANQQQPMVYNTVYQGSYTTQSAYPQAVATPNSCGTVETNQGFVQLTHGMQQMSIAANQNTTRAYPNGGYANSKCPQQFDVRSRSSLNKPNCKFNTKGISTGSGQSSTAPNSPAATVVTGYCPQNGPIYHTPPGTPPTQFAYPQNYGIPPMLYRQLSSGSTRTATPNRGSRSPTPSDLSHYDRQRMSLPPNIYQGMPYVVQPDARLAAGRGQPSAYRPGTSAPSIGRQQSFGSDNRSHSNVNRSRKSKAAKPTGLPPTGKQI